MIGTIQIKCSAHNPSMPLCPVFAFQDSYQQVRISDVPKKIGDWSIKRVEVECQFPDNKVGKFDCSLIGGVWATTISACSTAGTTTNGFVVNGYDENGNKYVLGKSDLYIMTNDSRIVPQKELVVVNILPNKPDAPHIGDIVFVDGKFEIYDGEKWISNEYIESEDGKKRIYGNGDVFALTSGTESWTKVGELALKSDIPHVPTRTSELENDSDFANKDFVNSSIATNTANFKGTFNNESEFPTEATNNDYLFWKTVDEDGNTIYKRYKYIASTSTWTYEYTLNNSSFTAEQWATINGGPYATQTSLNDKQDKLPYNDVWDVYDVGCWNAVNATKDVNGNFIDETYATKEELNNAIGNVLTQEEF